MLVSRIGWYGDCKRWQYSRARTYTRVRLPEPRREATHQPGPCGRGPHRRVHSAGDGRAHSARAHGARRDAVPPARPSDAMHWQQAALAAVGHDAGSGGARHERLHGDGRWRGAAPRHRAPHLAGPAGGGLRLLRAPELAALRLERAGAHAARALRAARGALGGRRREGGPGRAGRPRHRRRRALRRGHGVHRTELGLLRLVPRAPRSPRRGERRGLRLHRPAAGAHGAAAGLRGNHLSNTTCLMLVFLKSGEQFGKLWWSLTL